MYSDAYSHFFTMPGVFMCKYTQKLIERLIINPMIDYRAAHRHTGPETQLTHTHTHTHTHTIPHLEDGLACFYKRRNFGNQVDVWQSN